MSRMAHQHKFSRTSILKLLKKLRRYNNDHGGGIPSTLNPCDRRGRHSEGFERRSQRLYYPKNDRFSVSVGRERHILSLALNLDCRK